MNEAEPIISIHLSAHTPDRVAALKVVETFSRMMVGLALDGLDLILSVNVLDEEELEEFECDHDGEEV